MLSNKATESKNITENMSLYDFWCTHFQSLLPFLADEAHTSICHLKKVYPDLLKIFLLKLSTEITQSQIDDVKDSNFFYSKYMGNSFLSDFSITENLTDKEINFTTLKELSKQSQTIFERFFEDDTQKSILAGVLLERTELTLDKLLTVWQTITAVVVLSLANITALMQHKITMSQMMEWLATQPCFFIAPNDVGLINALNYQSNVSFAEIQKQQQKWLQDKKFDELLPYQQIIVQQMQSYQVTNLFKISPLKNSSKIIQNDIGNDAIEFDKAVKTNSELIASDNIFVKSNANNSSQWINTLQKNWIATATVLSIAVFGGVGAFVTVKDKSAVTQPTTQSLPQKPKYQDVAIIKVPSESSAVNSEMKLKEGNAKDNKSKSLKNKELTKQHLQQDSKKSVKEEDSKKNVHKKLSDSERKNDRKKMDNKQNDSKPIKDENEKSETTHHIAKKTSKHDNDVKNKSTKKDNKDKTSKDPEHAKHDKNKDKKTEHKKSKTSNKKNESD